MRANEHACCCVAVVAGQNISGSVCRFSPDGFEDTGAASASICSLLVFEAQVHACPNKQDLSNHTTLCPRQPTQSLNQRSVQSSSSFVELIVSAQTFFHGEMTGKSLCFRLSRM